MWIQSKNVELKEIEIRMGLLQAGGWGRKEPGPYWSKDTKFQIRKKSLQNSGYNKLFIVPLEQVKTRGKLFSPVKKKKNTTN